jgi:hypothetical protein
MMARHVKDDEGPKTLELGKLIAGGHGVHGDPEPDWEDPPPRRWPMVVGVLSAALAAYLGWLAADLGELEPRASSTPPTAVETVTAEASPGPTVTRWRTRPPAAGKVPEATPVPGPTVTRWRTRLKAPSPAPTVTAWRTRLVTPQEEMDDEDPQIPGSPGPGD